MSNDDDASGYRPRRAAGPVDGPDEADQAPTDSGEQTTPPGRRAAGYAANDSATDEATPDEPAGTPRRGLGFAPETGDPSTEETSINPVVTDTGPIPTAPTAGGTRAHREPVPPTEPERPTEVTPPARTTPESGRPTAPRALSVRREPVVDAPVPPRKDENEGERPVNPFAPKAEPEQKAPEEPQGRRVAEPERTERNPLKRLRGKRSETKPDDAAAAAEKSDPGNAEGDEERTTVLPAGAAAREAGPGEPKAAADAKQPKKKRSKRNMVAVGVSIAAGIAIVALVASFGVWTLGNRGQSANQPPTTTNSEPGPPLTEQMLLSQNQADLIDDSREWTVAGTETGISDRSASAPCVAAQPSGQPGPQITYLRTLTSSGDDRSALLHRADSFATVEDAQKVFNFRSAEIGACGGTPYFLESGLGFADLGDQAVGVRLQLREQTPEYHTIVIVRTGRTVNVFDAHKLGEAMNRPGLTNAIGEVVNSQCGSAGGLCTGSGLASAETVPPPAGDAPGFMVPNDLPRLNDGVGSWNATPVTTDLNIGSGTGCEGVDLGTLPGATEKGQRTFLLRDDPAAPTGFGADEVLMTFGSNADATAQSDRISQGLARCQQSTLTGQATNPAAFETQVNGVDVRGFTSTVTQRLEGGQEARYRVAVVVADKKLVYLLNNADRLDFSDQAWTSIATRAGQRATQSR